MPLHLLPCITKTSSTSKLEDDTSYYMRALITPIAKNPTGTHTEQNPTGYRYTCMRAHTLSLSHGKVSHLLSYPLLMYSYDAWGC